MKDRPLVFVRLFPPPGQKVVSTSYTTDFSKWSAPPMPTSVLGYPKQLGSWIAGQSYQKQVVKTQVEGFPVDISDRILSFRYEDEERKADQCEITVDNQDCSQFDNPSWRLGGVLEVSWGFPGNMSPVRKVIIQKIRGSKELKVEGHGMAMVLHKKKVSKVWAGKTLFQIAEELNQKYKAIYAGVAGGEGDKTPLLPPSNPDAVVAAEAMKLQVSGDRTQLPLALQPELQPAYKAAKAELLASNNQSRVNAGISLEAKAVKIAIAHQSAQTDAQFLDRLARKYGYRWYIDHEGFHLKKVDENFRKTPSKRLTWFYGEGEWIEFDYENDQSEKPSKVKTTGVDPATNTVFSSEGSNENTKRAGLAPNVTHNWAKDTAQMTPVIDWKERLQGAIAKVPESDVKRSMQTRLDAMAQMVQRPPEAPAEESDSAPFSGSDANDAKAHADGKYKKRKSAAHQLNGKIIGDPSFMAKSVVHVEGIGRRLSGNWLVKKVEHQIDGGGYLCSFKAERDGDNGFGEKKNSGAAVNSAKPKEKADESKMRHAWDEPTAAIDAKLTPYVDPTSKPGT